MTATADYYYYYYYYSELENSDISRHCFKLCLKTWLFKRAYS